MRGRGACVDAFAETSRSDELRAARVSRSVLARTTREDLRRRRDVGLVLDFVTDRLRASQWLRVAVALLIVQLTLVPLVAWHLVGKAERPHLNIRLSETLEELGGELPSRDELLEELPEIVDDEPMLPDLTPLPLPGEGLRPVPTVGEIQWLAGLDLPLPTTELGALLKRTTDALVGLDPRTGSPEAAWGRLQERLESDPTQVDVGEAWIASLASALRASVSVDPYVTGWVEAAARR